MAPGCVQGQQANTFPSNYKTGLSTPGRSRPRAIREGFFFYVHFPRFGCFFGAERAQRRARSRAKSSQQASSERGAAWAQIPLRFENASYHPRTRVVHRHAGVHPRFRVVDAPLDLRFALV